MPGRLFLTHDGAEIARHLGAALPQGLSVPPRLNIAPGQPVIACPPDRRLAEMRWGIVPVGRVNARGRPVMETLVNVRGETLFEKSAFEGFSRCLIPASGWYEWTGKPRRKTAWRISRSTGEPAVLAGVFDIWTAPGGRALAQVASVTCEPSDDVRAIHHRMGVILNPLDFAGWLDGDEATAAALVRPLAAGSLTVEPAEGVDWDGP